MQLPPYHSISYHTTIKYYRTVASLTIIRIFLHENWNDARVENVEYLLSKKHNIYKVHVQIVCSLIILASTTRVVTIRWLHVRCFFSSTYLALAFSYVPQNFSNSIFSFFHCILSLLNTSIIQTVRLLDMCLQQSIEKKNTLRVHLIKQQLKHKFNKFKQRSLSIAIIKKALLICVLRQNVDSLEFQELYGSSCGFHLKFMSFFRFSTHF